MKHTFYHLYRPEAPGMFELAVPKRWDGDLTYSAKNLFFDGFSKVVPGGYPEDCARDIPQDASKHADMFYSVVVKRKSAFNGLPDRMDFVDNHQLVSERCCDAIQEIDPNGGHQFIPATLIDSKGEV